MVLIIKKFFKDNIFVRYVFSGALVSVGELTIFALLIYTWDWGYLLASAIIFFFGLIASFILRKAWVFSHKGCYQDKQQLMLYSVIFSLSTLVNLIIMFILVDRLKISEFISQVLALILVGFFTYLANRAITFKPLQAKQLNLTNYIKTQQETN